jgi:hypothetical protein
MIVPRRHGSSHKARLEHRFIIQKGMDHKYIPDPGVIGEIFSFFDKYLKP